MDGDGTHTVQHGEKETSCKQAGETTLVVCSSQCLATCRTAIADQFIDTEGENACAEWWFVALI
jgi:hypothetical protein